LFSLPNLVPRGLMTVAPLVHEPGDAIPVFRQLRELRDRVREDRGLAGFSELSMGMSNDFREAISQGATMVRLGRAVFGERPAQG
jgi:uncharacterized pyridoxal phosphate-containing UPF0001 family protein